MALLSDVRRGPPLRSPTAPPTKRSRDVPNQQLLQGFTAKGLGEVGTLSKVASQFPEYRGLASGFYAFRHRFYAQGVRQADRPRHYRPVPLIVPQPVDERPVDLQRVDRRVLDSPRR